MKKLCRMALVLAVLFTGLGVAASAPPDACAREPGGGCSSYMAECSCPQGPGQCGFSQLA